MTRHMLKHLFLAALLSTSAVIQAETLVMISINANVYTVDTVTGAHTLVSNYPFTEVRGLAYHAPRDSYFFVTDSKLYEFELGGQPVLRRNLEFVGADGEMWDIAIDRAGVVWGTEAVSSGPDKLWRFGTASGSTFIGLTFLNGQLDFGADGSLYRWHGDGNPNFDGLFVVNKLTGEDTRINPVGDPPNLSGFCTMDTFNSAYGQEFNGPLHFVRLYTGSVTLVGGPDTDFRGAAHGVAKKFPADVSLGTVNLGKVEDNEPGCLEDRDGEPLRVCKFIVPNTSLPPIRFELNINGPSSLTVFDMVYKAKMSAAGGFRMNIQAKRLVGGLFDTIATMNLSTTYSTQSRVNQDSTPYLNASGNGVFRIEVQQTGPSASPSFCFDLDQFAVVVD